MSQWGRELCTYDGNDASYSKIVRARSCFRCSFSPLHSLFHFYSISILSLSESTVSFSGEIPHFPYATVHHHMIRANVPLPSIQRMRERKRESRCPMRFVVVLDSVYIYTSSYIFCNVITAHLAPCIQFIKNIFVLFIIHVILPDEYFYK